MTTSRYASALPPGPILVTGATGFIGRHVVGRLTESGRAGDVVAVARGARRSIDLREATAVAALVREVRPSVILHLAGLVYSADVDALYRANVAPTRLLLEAVLAHAPDARVVVPGSAAEYGRVPAEELPAGETRLPAPLVPYGLAKTWQTATATFFGARGAQVVVARLFNVVGPDAPAGLSVGVFAEQLRAIRRGDAPSRLVVGDLAPRRDFIDIEDACDALFALAAAREASGIVNVCRGESVSMAEVLRMLIEESGCAVEVVVDPALLRHRTEIPDSVGATTRMHALTGWRPVISLRESLARMLHGRPPG